MEKNKNKKKKVATQFTLMHPSLPRNIQYGWDPALG
jgi:hypothetical protein